MQMATLDHIQTLVDQLSPRDQVRLMQYLTKSIATQVFAEELDDEPSSPPPNDWNDLWRQLDDPAAVRVGSHTASEELFAMRR